MLVERSCPHELQEGVNEMIAIGWIPQGGVCFVSIAEASRASEEYEFFVQAMTRVTP